MAKIKRQNYDYDDYYEDESSYDSYSKKRYFNWYSEFSYRPSYDYIISPIIPYAEQRLIKEIAEMYLRFRSYSYDSLIHKASVKDSIEGWETKFSLRECEFIDLFNYYYRRDKVIDPSFNQDFYKRLPDLYFHNLFFVTCNSVYTSIAITCEIAIAISKGQPVDEGGLSELVSQASNLEYEMESNLGGIEDNDQPENSENKKASSSTSLIEKLTSLHSMLQFKDISMNLMVNSDFLYNISDKLYSSVKNTFSESPETIDVQLLESDIIAEIAAEDLPIFALPDCIRKALISDIHTIQPVGNPTFDLYLDVSGSMDSTIRINGKGVMLIDLAKTISMILKKRGIIRDIYVFNGNLRKCSGIKELLQCRASGGTSFTPVVENALNFPDRNVLVITDGEGSETDKTPYHDRITWIGVDYHMKYFTNSSKLERLQYASNKKVFVYDTATSSIVLAE